MTTGPLDLSGADTTGFDPLPTGRYKAAVWDAEWTETKGSEGSKLPAGCPMLSVQFRLIEKIGDPEAYDEKQNRRVFSSYTIPPKGYENEAKVKGMIVNFLKAAGYGDEVTKKGFELDIEDLKGREVVLILGHQAANLEKGWEARNTVRGVKSVEEAGAVSSGSGLL